MSALGTDLFIIRLWDGMDGDWTDVSEPMSETAAKEEWNRLTENGTKMHNFDQIDYYRVFPANTTMFYAGGREMFR